MGKFWSLLFLLVPMLGVACRSWSRPSYKHWLPHDISQHGHTIDHLFYFILWLTGAGVRGHRGACCSGSCGGTTAASNAQPGEVHARQPQPGNRLDDHPGGHAVVHRHLPDERLGRRRRFAIRRRARRHLGTADDMPPTLEVTGRQFEWRLRYPGSRPGQAGRRRTTSIIVNDLHVPVNEEILVDLKSADVLHELLPAQPARQARRGAGHEDSGLVPGDRDRHLRPGVRRAVRLGTLQDEGPA